MLSEAFLKHLESMRLTMRHPATGGTSGLRRSKALGTSVEFSDFREYAMGDDLRRVDWNAYGRFDKLFVKLFMEEQEAHLHLIVDGSASMGFGTPSKWDTAVKLAEALGYLALSGGDMLTLSVLQGDRAVSTTPLSGRRSYVKAEGFLQGFRPEGETNLSAATRQIPFGAGRGISIVLSDFLSPEGYETALQFLAYRKQETIALQVMSREEHDPSLEDAVLLVDAETGAKLEFLAGYDTLKAYRETVQEFLAELQRFCHQKAMLCAAFPAEADVEGTLMKELARMGLVR